MMKLGSQGLAFLDSVDKVRVDGFQMGGTTIFSVKKLATAIFIP